jgi:hypothetical protein
MCHRLTTVGFVAINFKSLERDAGEKPISTFSHPALGQRLIGK